MSTSPPSGSTGRPILIIRLPTTANRSALPARSPYPLAVHCTWVAPACTAATVLATAQLVSSWQWMPSRKPVRSRTSVTIRSTHIGSMPPLVSQSTVTSAPAVTAASATRSP